MYKKYRMYALLLLPLLILGGCGSGSESGDSVNKTKSSGSESKNDGSTNESTTINTVQENTIYDSNLTALRIEKLRLDVHANSFTTTTKLLQDMNSTLGSFEKLSVGATGTIELASQLLIKLAKPFSFIDTTAPFKLNTNMSATVAPFIITAPLYPHKYLLVSSSSRFFLEKQSLKTLFADAVTLANAWKRAVANRDTKKDLYVTIVSLQSDNALRNLTNGLLIKSDQLQ